MKIKGDFYPFLLFMGWLALVGWVVKETKIDHMWFVIVGLGPMPIAVAIEMWKEDKNRQD